MRNIWNVGWHTMQPSNFTSSTANNWKRIQSMWWLKCNVFWKLRPSWTIRINCDSMRKRDSSVQSLKVIAPNVWVNQRENRIRTWMIGAWKCYKGKWERRGKLFFLIGKLFWMALFECFSNLFYFMYLVLNDFFLCVDTTRIVEII